MITVKEIENLANLARIKLDESEKQSLTKEIDSILNYIDEIKKATVNIDFEPTVGAVNNIYREDSLESISSDTREAILNEAPDREGDFVAVKKIIDQEQFDL